jgi:hypothetical protein
MKETIMSSNNRDETPQQSTEPDEPITEANEGLERDPMKIPVQPTDAEPRPAERPDLGWAEHED